MSAKGPSIKKGPTPGAEGQNVQSIPPAVERGQQVSSARCLYLYEIADTSLLRQK